MASARLPGPHGKHLSDAVEDTLLPAHFWQSLPPVPNSPALQGLFISTFVHPLLPGFGSEPLGQELHVLDPGVENKVGWHDSHWVAPRALKVPPGHSSQNRELRFDLNVPALHGTHAPVDDDSDPGSQKRHSVEPGFET